MLGAHDDPLGVLANMGVYRPSRWQLLYTLATMIAVLNGVVGGSAVAFLVSVLGGSLPVATVEGALVAGLSVWVHLRWQRHLHDVSREQREVLYPSES